MSDQLLQRLQTAYQLHQAGEVDQAEKLYKRVLDEDRRNIHALNLMGMLCVNSGRPEEAVVFLQRALKMRPNDNQTHANIGLAFKDQSEFRQAAQHLQRSLELDDGNPVIHNNLGNVLRELEQPKEAIRCFERALKLQPDAAEFWSNLAAALNENDQPDHALKAADRALSLNPQLAQAHNNRGDIRLKQARYQEAYDCYRQASELDPKYFAALINIARAQRDLDEPEAALQTLRSVLDMEPRHPEAHFVMGVLLEQMGQQSEAAESFKDAIDAAPQMASAHYQLAQLKGRDIEDHEFHAMQELWENGELGRSDRMYLAFGLYRALDQRKQFDEAFKLLAIGNELKSEISPYDDAEAKKYMDSLVDTAAVCLESAADIRGCPDARPVFVLGMPRSGTSLTEQILASHSEVAGAGERSFAFDMAHRAKALTGKAFPHSMRALTESQYGELGEYYLSRHSERDLEHRYVVDKTPLNFQYIGLLALALPNAKFIHCHRDPVQNCFSIHQLPFDKKQTYAHDLVALGSYYKRYWRLMQEWHRLLPGRILDVRYEDTVDDIEDQSQRMLAFLGLDFEDSVLEFHKTRRLVKTPSASQVRAPIYTDQVQAWRKYARHLQPLVDTLSDLTMATS